MRIIPIPFTSADVEDQNELNETHSYGFYLPTILRGISAIKDL